ncbi:MAG: glycosyltransferase [Ignavibacteriaceae bacterium]|nr:glycosyltransferase [Ignavibacteriaceae bacterium]
MTIELYLILIIALLLFNYLYFLAKINSGIKCIKSEKLFELPDEFVSVIVPFRNESENILQSLKSITSQNYPPDKFEIIFVNDFSTDDSLDKLVKANNHENVRILSLKVRKYNRAFKKQAVNYGIDCSKGEIIVTTDADCKHNKNWLRNLLSNYDDNTALVSGPVSFIPNKNLFSKVLSLEFAGIILAGAGLIGIGKPIICNGANLTFRKKVFNEINGYANQIHLSSGEDELLMQQIAAITKYNIKFCWNDESVVLTYPPKNLIDFFQQRSRWASKGLFYPDKGLIIKLVLIFLFYVSIISQAILAVFFNKIFLLSLLICFILKFCFEYIIVSKGIGFLFDKRLIKYFVVTGIFQTLYLPLASLGGLMGKFKWKDRKLNR